jgi:hypothetical protein
MEDERKEVLENDVKVSVFRPTKKDLPFPKGMTQLKRIEGGMVDSRGKKYYRDVNGSLRKVK